MVKIPVRLVPFLLLLSLSFGLKSTGKLDQADSSTNRMNVIQRVGDSFLQLGIAQSNQSNNPGTVLVVSIIALVTVVVLCLASQCIVHHVKLAVISGKDLSEGIEQI